MSPLAEFLFLLVTGVIIAVGMLATPHSLLRKLGRISGMSPNWVTLWSIPFTWCGVALYFNDVTVGFHLVVFGLTLDRLDGKMAAAGEPCEREDPPPTTVRGRLRRFWEELNHPGRTETGKWLDPLADKLKIPVPLLLLGMAGFVPLYYPVLILVFEFISTIMRPPFRLIPESWQRGTAATGVGKLKVTFQFMVFILVWVEGTAWLHVPGWLIHATFILALLFGIMSVASRLRFPPGLKWLARLVDRFTRLFSHER